MFEIKSVLNGRLENEVDNFIATLEHEFEAIEAINRVIIEFVHVDGKFVKHTFHVPVTESSGELEDYLKEE